MGVQLSPPHQNSEIPVYGIIRIHPEYRITGQISADATGILFSAESNRENRHVAIRLFSGEVLPARIQEDKAPPPLPHIVGVRQILRSENGTPFAVMDLPRGDCLADSLNEQQTLPADIATRITLKVALIVRALHVHGICHGHVNAENVFFSRQPGGRIDVQLLHHRLKGSPADFNLPPYLSPQLCIRSGELSNADDDWAVSILLYRMLSGTVPFAGSSPWEVLKSMRQCQFSLPAAIKNQFPLLSVFLQKSLAGKVSDRLDGAQMNLSLKSILATRRTPPQSPAAPEPTAAEIPAVAEGAIQTRKNIELPDSWNLFDAVVLEKELSLPPAEAEVEERDARGTDLLDDLDDWELEEAFDFLDDSELNDEQQTVLLLGYQSPELIEAAGGISDPRKRSRSDITRPLVISSVSTTIEMENLSHTNHASPSSDTTSVVPDNSRMTAGGTNSVAGGPNSRVSTQSATLRSIDASMVASREQRKRRVTRIIRSVALNGGIAVVTFFGIVFLFHGNSKGDDIPVTATSAIHVSGDNPAAAATAPADASGANFAAPAETVTIYLKNVPPKSHVQLNGIRANLPIVVPKSTKPVIIDVLLGERIVFTTRLSPLVDQEIPVAMTSRR